MINWHFIEELEGAAVTVGYVPRDGDGNVLGNSGVTIASGVGWRVVGDGARPVPHRVSLRLCDPDRRSSGAGVERATASVGG